MCRSEVFLVSDDSSRTALNQTEIGRYLKVVEEMTPPESFSDVGLWLPEHRSANNS
jgi:hypothetical protein